MVKLTSVDTGAPMKEHKDAALLTKVSKVLLSCRTLEQLEVARKYSILSILSMDVVEDQRNCIFIGILYQISAQKLVDKL